MIRNNPFQYFAAVPFAALMSFNAHAIDQVYHPYVEPQVKELDYRVTGYSGGDDNKDYQVHRLGVGYGVSQHVALEGYVIGQKYGGDAMRLDAYALEGLWQLYDQGAEWLDSALLFEYEAADDGSYQEVGIGYLAEKEIGRWSATGNLIARYDIEGNASEKPAGEMVAQARYRLIPEFEPAIEVHWDEDIVAAGPAATGLLRLDARNRLKWQLAALLTLEHDIADKVFRASLDWEF